MRAYASAYVAATWCDARLKRAMGTSPLARWGLLPSERVLWHGGPGLGLPRDLRWTIVPALFLSLALITALFAGLIHIAGIPGVRSMAFLAFYLLMTAVAVWTAPQFLLDPCEFLVSERQQALIWLFHAVVATATAAMG